MNKRYIISVLLILFVAILSVSFVSAWWDSSFECEGFTIEMPEGVEVATGYSPSTPPQNVELVEDSEKDKWDFLNLDLSEAPLENLPDSLDIVENHTEGGLTIVKGQIIGDDTHGYLDGTNISYAEFDKEGKHFYLAINHDYRSIDQIDLTKDTNLVKELKESIKLK